MVIVSLPFILPVGSVSARWDRTTVPTVAERALSTPELIDQALADGQITADERLLYLAYAVYEYESLPAQFRSDVGWSRHRDRGGGEGYVAVRLIDKAGSYPAPRQRDGSIACAQPGELICDATGGEASNNDSTSANLLHQHYEHDIRSRI